MLERYYQVLGVSSSASLDEIKKAFKRRARELHPDVNKAADAHEQFILLNEAYQYLQNLKTGKIYSSQRRSYTPSGTYGSYEDYAKRERDDARKRAEFYARKRYRDFQQSAYYKRSMEIKAMANQIFILFLWSFIVGVPLLCSVIAGFYGFIAGLVILIFASPRIIPELKSAGPLDLNYLKKGIIYLCGHPLVQLTVLTVINLAIILTVILNTLINPLSVVAAFVILLTAAFILSRRTNYFKQGRKRVLFVAGIAPSAVTVFFLMNYLISFNPVKEFYRFTFRQEYYSNGRRFHSIHSKEEHNSRSKSKRVENTTMIILEGNKYEDYVGIRFFFNRRPKKASEITYTIEDGVFGLRVVKAYTFSSPLLRKRMKELAD